MSAPIAVLVADDDPGVRTSVAEILRQAGYLVEEAEDGQVALTQLAGRHFDVLLLDMRMPHLDGMGVVEALAQPIVVIMISAYDLHEQTERIRSRVFRFLRKPVPPAQLLSVVAEAAVAAAAASSP